MTTAALDYVGFLPSPATKNNRGSGDLLGGHLYAYGCGSGIVVVEVGQLQVAAVLQGAHKSSPVTAVKWSPDCHSRDLKSLSHLRLASGDRDGLVVVWDVLSQSPVAALDDSTAILSHGSRRSSGGGVAGTFVAGGAVQGLAWVKYRPRLLAVLTAPATLLLWDSRGGVLVWKRELSATEPFVSLAPDPLDAGRLAACGANTTLAVITLTNPSSDDVDVKLFRVAAGAGQQEGSVRGGKEGASAPATAGAAGNIGGGGSSGAGGAGGVAAPHISACFSAARDVVHVVTPREFKVVDLELGVVAASKTLHSSKPSFSHLLGVWGRGVSAGGGDEGGADCAYAVHVDGALSIWVRTPGELSYACSCWARLLPQGPRGSGSPSSPAPALLAVNAAVWKQGAAPGDPLTTPNYCAGPGGNSEEVTKRLALALMPDRVLAGHESSGGAGRGPSSAGQATGASVSVSDLSVLIMALTSDGRVWAWDAPLPSPLEPTHKGVSLGGAALVPSSGPGYGGPSSGMDSARQSTSSIPASPAPSVPPAAAPQLVGLLHNLPHQITSLSLHPRLVLTGRHYTPAQSDCLPVGCGGQAVGGVEEVVVVGAAVTASGNMEVFTVQRGQAAPLSVQVAASLQVHKGGRVKGVRWLGDTPRLVTFSSHPVHPPGSSGAASGTGVGGLGGEGVMYRNVLAITDVTTRRTTTFRDFDPEPTSVTSLRVSPSGSHLLVIVRGAPSELWGVPPNATPTRLRLLDLPMTAVEWVSHTDPLLDPLHSTANLTRWSKAARQAAEAHKATPPAAACAGQSQGGSRAQGGPSFTSWSCLQPGAAQADAAAAAAMGPAVQQPMAPTTVQGAPEGAGQAPVSQGHAGQGQQAQAGAGMFTEELLAFSLMDGRAGVLAVCGKSVADTKAQRPMGGSMQPLEIRATAIAAWVRPGARQASQPGHGTTVVMGDAEGRLHVWDTASGRCVSLLTGHGPIKRIQAASGPHPTLYAPPDTIGPIRMRLAVLFAVGSFGVYEMDWSGRVRTGHASPPACARAGRVLDMAWLPLPLPLASPAHHPHPSSLSAGSSRRHTSRDGRRESDATGGADGAGGGGGGWGGLSASGGGSVLAIVTEDGALAMMDMSQVHDRLSHPSKRTDTLRTLLATPALVPCPAPSDPPTPTATAATVDAPAPPAMHVCLGPARSMGTSLMLPRPWVLLLRLLLQLGLPQATLQYLTSCICAHTSLHGPRAHSGHSGHREDGGEGAARGHVVSTPKAHGRVEGGDESVEEEEAVAELLTLVPQAVHKVMLDALRTKHHPLDAPPPPRLQPPPPGGSGGGSLHPHSHQHSPLPGATPDTSGLSSTADLLGIGMGTDASTHGGHGAGQEVTTSGINGSAATAQATTQPDMGSPPSTGLNLMRAVSDAFRMVGVNLDAGIPGVGAGSPAQPAPSSPPFSRSLTIASGQAYGGSVPRPNPNKTDPNVHAPGRVGAAGAALGHSPFKHDMLGLIRHLAQCRAQGKLLHPQEWRAYSAALALAPPTPHGGLPAAGVAGQGAGAGVPDSVRALCGRMAVAAGVAGDDREARFWSHLPATLQAVAGLRDANAARTRMSDSNFLGGTTQAVGSAPGRTLPGRALPVAASEPPPPLRPPPPLPNTPNPHQLGSLGGAGGHGKDRLKLWDEDLTLGEAQERALWHETLARTLYSDNAALQERRVLEYVALGDFATAVAFLLASEPEQSARYYRDALVTVALAAAANARPDPAQGRALGGALQVKAAKVVAAHAAGVGDPLLSVPLYCAAGLYSEAVAQLQECGLWRYAASLTAHALSDTDRAVALSRWAVHVEGGEGDVWRAVGLLTAGGCLREALQVMVGAGLPDCAAAFAAACAGAGLTATVRGVPASGSPPVSMGSPPSPPFSVPTGSPPLTSPVGGGGARGAVEGGDAFLASMASLNSADSGTDGLMRDVDALLTSTLSGGSPTALGSGTAIHHQQQLHATELFSMLPAQASAILSSIAASSGSSGGVGVRGSFQGGPGAATDLGSVQLAFERYISDLVQHL